MRGTHTPALVVRCLLAATMVCLLCGADWADRDKSWQFNIPSQNVDDALRALAEQTGTQLLFPYDQVTAQEANSLAGRYTLEEALEIMLRGTGLTGDVTGSGVITISLDTAAKDQYGGENMGNEKKNGMLARLATAVLSVFAANGANGQDASQLEDFALEEIVVTARRVSETLQRTPLSISTIQAEEIESLGLVQLSDIGQWTPNLEMQGAAVFIRGVGQGDTLMTTDPGVAIYIDGVYIARQSGTPSSLMNVERVEVLRGPQGTLFGKNSLGGAISISTATPGDEFEGRIRGRIGERSLVELDGFLAGPVADNLAGSISIGGIKQQGYYTNLETGEDFNEINRTNGRVKLQWQASDSFYLTLAGNYERTDQNPGGTTNMSIVPGTSPAFFGGGTIPLSGADTGTVQTQYHGLYNASAGCTPQTANSAPECFGPQYEQAPFTTEETDATPEEGDNWGVSLTAEFDFDDAVLKSITAYREFDMSYSTGTDGSPLPLADLDAYDDQEQFSQELQLTGTAFDNKLTYTGGLYYFRETARNNTRVRFLRTVPPIYPISGIDDGTGAPVMIPPGEPLLLPTQILFVALNLDTYRTQKTTSTAAYAQLGYSLSDTFSLTLGARFNEDEKEFNFEQFDLTGPPPGIPGVMDAASPRLKESWNSFTPRLGAEWKFSDDLMVYASYANGYKSGGFNARPTTDPPRFESYEPEELDTYELGLKSEWLNRRLRLNVAAFRSDYKEIQLPTFFFVDGIYITETTNAGDGTIKGLEADFAAAISPRLMLTASLGILDFEYGTVQDVVGPGTNTPPGEMLPFTSKNSWTLGVDAILAETRAGKLGVRVDYNHRSKFVFDVFNINSQAPYGLLNLRVDYTSHDGRWSVYALGKNVTDQQYAVGANDFALFGIAEQRAFGPPQEWSLGFDFDFR
jgi:iron complex outermembrane receptor protein